MKTLIEDESRGFKETFENDIKYAIKSKIHSKTSKVTTPVHHAQYNASHPTTLIKQKVNAKLYEKFGGSTIGNAFSHAASTEFNEKL